jgi:restriction system protein
MAVPDFQQLRKPVLLKAAQGEQRISDVVEQLAEELKLSKKDREELLPSGKQTRFANRVHWAKSYLKQAGLIKNTKRAHFIITQRGKELLKTHSGMITREDLRQYDDFLDFESRTSSVEEKQSQSSSNKTIMDESNSTPDEVMRNAYEQINRTLAHELLEKVRDASPLFFEHLIIQILIAMNYGGTPDDKGRILGQSGDGGVDGVIDQDPLGVDQIYVQAKRYKEGNNVGSGAIRDFFGALNIKRATKGIFFTTSKFSPAAVQTAAALGTRIVLIDGIKLARLMIKYGVACQTEEVLEIKKIDEDFFDNF